MLRSDLCDYSDAYIVVKRAITVEDNNANNREDKNLTFKNNAPYRSCISNLNNILIDNAEDLGIFTLLYNLLEDSNFYSMTSECLWNYYRDEVNDNANETNADN